MLPCVSKITWSERWTGEDSRFVGRSVDCGRELNPCATSELPSTKQTKTRIFVILSTNEYSDSEMKTIQVSATTSPVAIRLDVIFEGQIGDASNGRKPDVFGDIRHHLLKECK